MKRVVVFVDGFNLYHAIACHRRKNDGTGVYRPYVRYRWLNLKALAEQFLGRNEHIEEVRYYTAFVPWDQHKEARHKIYVKALETTAVKTVLGKFTKKEKRCRLCGKTFETYEEKHTDVNIAVDLLASCIEDRHDCAWIISGDNDLTTALEKAKQLYPAKEIMILLPIDSRAERLKKWAKDNGVNYSRINEQHLRNAQLPAEIDCGEKIIKKPVTW
ncbi:MAG: NYN domain-containing protein [Negativicutes bacterium]